MVELATSTPLQDHCIAQAPFQVISSLLSTVNVNTIDTRINFFRFLFLNVLISLCVCVYWSGETATSPATDRHAGRMLLLAIGVGGFTVDPVAAAGTPTAVAWNVHRLQPPLSTASAFVTRPRSLHIRRPPHSQTQRGELPSKSKSFQLIFLKNKQLFCDIRPPGFRQESLHAPFRSRLHPRPLRP